VGISYRSVGALPAPFLLFDERVTEIPPGSSLVTNSAQEFKIIVLLAGGFRQHIDGGRAFAYRAGDAAVFPGPCRQEIIPEDPGRPQTLHAVRILFRQDAIVQARRRERPEESLESLLVRECPGPRNIPGFLNEETSHVFRQLRSEADHPGPERRQAIFGLLTTLTVFVLRRLRPDPSTAAIPPLHRSAAIVRKAQAFMSAYFSRRLTLEEIAWDQKISEEHLARVFREVTGRTVFNYLEEIRIDASKQMLVQAGPSIASVAAHCGFGSPTRFGIHFKEHTGMTPSAYRSALGFSVNQQPSRFRRLRAK
jgi:AraC-like DNA-binding protein